MVIKRYIIPIIVILVLISGTLTSCNQTQKRQDIEEGLTYLQKISAFGIDYLEATNVILDSDKAISQVIESRDEYRLLEVEAMQKRAVDQALGIVDSELSTLAVVTPPIEAQILHELVIENLNKAKLGLMKWSHASAINYNRAYSLLHPSSPKKEYLSTAEEMRQARQLVFETIDDWDEILAEWDKVFAILSENQ